MSGKNSIQNIAPIKRCDVKSNAHAAILEFHRIRISGAKWLVGKLPATLYTLMHFMIACMSMPMHILCTHTLTY